MIQARYRIYCHQIFIGGSINLSLFSSCFFSDGGYILCIIDEKSPAVDEVHTRTAGF